MNSIVLSASAIALLIVVMLLFFAIASARGMHADEGIGRHVAKSTSSVGADYRDVAVTASPGTTSARVGYLDEGYQGEPTPTPVPAPARAPAAPAPVPVGAGAAPVGVGYMDV